MTVISLCGSIMFWQHIKLFHLTRPNYLVKKWIGNENATQNTTHVHIYSYRLLNHTFCCIWVEARVSVVDFKTWANKWRIVFLARGIFWLFPYITGERRTIILKVEANISYFLKRQYKTVDSKWGRTGNVCCRCYCSLFFMYFCHYCSYTQKA